MQVLFNRTFLKELASVPSKTRTKIEHLVFEEIKSYSSFTEIPALKKLTGFTHYYRIRVGDYRLGVKIINGEIS